MAKTLTDNWKLAENLTDYWHMPWILLSTDKGPDCPFFSTTLPEISNRHAQWEATLKKTMQFSLQRNDWEKIENRKKTVLQALEVTYFASVSLVFLLN